MRRFALATGLSISVVLFCVQLASAQIKTLNTLKEQVEPKEAALLIIDMQNDYIADQGLLGRIGLDVKRVQQMVPRLNGFVEEARKAGVMVIWITQSHTLRDAMPNYIAKNVATQKGKPFTENDFMVRENSWGAESYDKVIKPLPGELSVRKYTYGGFTNTNLDMYLRAAGKKTIICTGTATNVCVLSTALEGWHKGYYTILVSDCCETNEQIQQEATLNNWQVAFGFVARSSEITSLWKQ